MGYSHSASVKGSDPSIPPRIAEDGWAVGAWEDPVMTRGGMRF